MPKYEIGKRMNADMSAALEGCHHARGRRCLECPFLECLLIMFPRGSASNLDSYVREFWGKVDKPKKKI